MRQILGIIALLLVTACGRIPSAPSTAPAAEPRATPAPLPSAILASRTSPDLPAIHARRTAIAAALAADPPIMPLEGLDPTAQHVQARVLADPRVRALAFTATNPGPMLVEVFGVVPATPSDLTDAARACRTQPCFKLVLYHFATNATTTILSTADGAIVDLTTLPNTQPDVPPHLAALAVEIARAAPEVHRALQMEPAADLAVMEAVKTSLTGSACERSHHLCVAPVFRWGDRALWAITDLTDLALVGVQWTDLGAATNRRITETTLQNAVVSDLCDHPATFVWGDWRATYMLTTSDGLMLADVTYQNRPWLRQAKITDWHVRYPAGIDQATGFQDAVGCPTFSAAAVVPFDLPRIEPIQDGDHPIGVALVQDFQNDLWPIPCNYRYQNRFEFYADGRMRILAVNLGRGCGIGGVYRPILRIVPAGSAHTVAVFTPDGWQPWHTEQWMLQTDDLLRDPQDAHMRIIAAADGPALAIAPTLKPRPDHAFVYVSVYRPDEGDADLPALGDCCREDFRQGPDIFLTGESLGAVPVTLWYVPQMPNVEREACWADSVLRNGVFVPEIWPCAGGPWLLPVPPAHP